MDITEIIKEAFVFPSKDLGKLAIYIVLYVVLGALMVGATISSIAGLMDTSALIGVGAIIFIISFILSFILLGYQIGVVKSGIDLDETAPEYAWKDNLIGGIKYFIVMIVYYIIPAVVVLITAFATNVPGKATEILNQLAVAPTTVNATMNATSPAVNVISNTLMNDLASSLAIVGVVAIILFIIFAFIQTMASARLANTGSLAEAVNIIEAFKDIGRIGYGKVIGTIILSVIIVLIINVIISLITQYVPAISIITIIVTPYLTFFTSRITGLLYSDIA